jgi:serine/threonine-protein kinase HipA
MKKSGPVFFKDQRIGSISQTEERSFEFEYVAQNQNSVSWTLPHTTASYTSRDLFPFFDGLIPEGWLLNLVTKNWKIPANDRMTLLLTACQDCIGAVHIEPLKKTEAFSPAPNILKKAAALNLKIKRCLICADPLKGKETLTHTKCAKRLYGMNHTPMVDITLDDLEELALLQINQRMTLTGVQKKLSLSPMPNDPKKERLTVAGLDGRYILKPPTEDYPEMPQIEHASMKLAELHGLPVAKCGLIPLTSGELSYVTRRFDRDGEEKIQMEDFCQLSRQPTSQKYSGSSESLAKVIDEFSGQPADDKLTLFQMILFSFWIGNADMHLKNFSLWKDPDSQSVRMSPGYDFLSTRLLISKKEDLEELALPVNGRKNKLKWSDFQNFGNHLKIPEKVLKAVRDKMIENLPDSKKWIEKSFLKPGTQDKFIKILVEHTARLKT